MGASLSDGYAETRSVYVGPGRSWLSQGDAVVGPLPSYYFKLFSIIFKIK
jgi:hypothetical protein